MYIKRFELGMYVTNCYIIYGNQDGHCILIDPADCGKQLIQQLDLLNVVPDAVLLTHGHYDHILAVPALQEKYPNLPVYCHAADCPKELVEYDMGREFPTVSAFQRLQHITDMQTLWVAGFSIQVICTPGHTPGSVSFAIEDALFTGDTLFYGDIGRTDFAGGSYPQMMQSLKKLAALSVDYTVYPGHGDATTLGYERQYNPYIQKAKNY